MRQTPLVLSKLFLPAIILSLNPACSRLALFCSALLESTRLDLTIKRRFSAFAVMLATKSHDGNTTAMASYVGGRLSWMTRRGATIVLALFISATCVFFLTPYAPETRLSMVTNFANLESNLLHEPPECGPRLQVASLDIWNAAERKYRGLKDDKFTYVPVPHASRLEY